MIVEGTAVTVVDGWVSVRELCRALGLDFSRHREKAAKRFKTRQLKVARKEATGRVAYYRQTCIQLADAQVFVAEGGLWVRGRYQRRDP